MTRLPVILALAAAAAAPVADFRNVAAESGFTDAFPNGGTATKKYIVETTGSGVAFLDYDNDGRLDAFVVSGQGAPSRLYHNLGKGKFEDVTARFGMERDGWGQGVCAGDFDNDGFTDLAVTYWGGIVLWRNRAGRGFENITDRAGLKQSGHRYNTGCAFLDYDNDGDLDLFVANYVEFDFASTPGPGSNPYCWYRGIPVNCGPRGLPYGRNLLYRNEGMHRFTDVSESSGISKPDQNYCLGAVTGDFNQDGLIDLYVACDQTPSILYINQGGGKFEDEAVLRGAAFDENGKALSGMGAAAADYDGDGLPDIFRTNFSDERETLYRNRGEGNFDDRTLAAGLAKNTRFVGWGCAFLDFDNDGRPDLVLVNGHVFPEVDRLNLDIRYRDRAILYHNSGGGRFTDVSESAGSAVLEPHSARGLAAGDTDNDGSLEILVNNQNQPPSFWRQATKPAGNWILLKLEGARSNRSAIGARVTLTAGGRTQVAEIRGGGSYLSQSDLRLHFGLGSSSIADQIEIRWPSGAVQNVRGVRANRIHIIREETK